MESRKQWSWRGVRRTHAKPPPKGERAWIHPSELPNFESLDASPAWQLQSRTARTVGVVMAIALIAGAAGLEMTHSSHPASGAMPAHIATSVDVLPANGRNAAAHTVNLSITTAGHVANLAAMVLPNDLAVTTTPIPTGALITGSTTSHVNFPVTLIGRDKVMGFSIVHLGRHIAPLKFAPMPATAAVLAISPMMQTSNRSPQYAWADTTLGDPNVDSHGVISYLATTSDANLNGFTDAIAVNPAGRVVAVLSGNHQWYSAQFVARIAQIVATGRGCHASLGIIGASEQGGGVRVVRVVPKSPAQFKLRAGDVITKVNGVATDTFIDLSTELYLTPAYSEIPVTYLRLATLHTLDVTLGCDL